MHWYAVLCFWRSTTQWFARKVLTLKQVYLDYVLFIQEYAPFNIQCPQSKYLTSGRLMRKAAKKTRQAGEKRIAARDIRKVTMVCTAHPGYRPLLIMVRRLRCGSFEDDGSTRATEHSSKSNKPTSVASSASRRSVRGFGQRQSSSQIDCSVVLAAQNGLFDTKRHGAVKYQSRRLGKRQGREKDYGTHTGQACTRWSS